MAAQRLLIFCILISAFLVCCTEEDLPVPAPQTEKTELVGGTIAHIESTGFYIMDSEPLLTYHPWKMFDNNPSTNWFQAAGANNGKQRIVINFPEPVTANLIRIIPYNYESPEFLYYNRINTLSLTLDNNTSTHTAPPGVIIREIAFPAVSFSACTISIDSVYRGTQFNQLRIAEIEIWLNNKKMVFTESPEYKKVIAFDRYPAYRSPSGKKIILRSRGTYFCFPGGRFAQGNTVFKRTGYWSFSPYTMRIYANETRAATVEGTGNSVTVTEPYEREYYENYHYRDVEVNSGRSIDWLDAVYQAVHLKSGNAVILPISGSEWQMLSFEENDAVEEYLKKQEDRYKEIKSKNPFSN